MLNSVFSMVLLIRKCGFRGFWFYDNPAFGIFFIFLLLSLGEQVVSKVSGCFPTIFSAVVQKENSVTLGLNETLFTEKYNTSRLIDV